MRNQVTSVFGRFTNAIRDFTVAQRTIALIGLAVLILGVASLATWAAKPSYTPLFSGVSATDANTIVEQLRTDGVPYELTNGGATILVPEANVYDQRLKAAAAGMPSSSTGGYSLLDDMGVTSSEFQQSVTYKRALEGELASTIEALEGVKTSSVHLAIPEETVFISEATDPTASVFVETDDGVTLSTDQVQAIVHLTSASIEGMDPASVAVVDAAGTVLSAVGIGATGTADQQASDYEQRVGGAVQSMLNQVVGPGNATVVVAAEMNYETAERVEETFTTPDDAPALNESVSTEEYEGSGGGAAGVLGPDNIAGPDDGAGEGTFTSEDTTRNNALNKVTESRIIPAGSIERQTVSVALDAAAAGALDVADVTALVASAAGIDAARGDEVTVEVVTFNTAGAEEAAAALAAAEAAAAAEQRAELIRTGLIAAAIIVAVIIVLLVLRRSRRDDREPVDIGELDEFSTQPAAIGAGTRAAALGRSSTAALAAPVPSLEPAPATTTMQTVPAAPVPDPARASADRKRMDIENLAEQDPERAAGYLRGLMDDRASV